MIDLRAIELMLLTTSPAFSREGWVFELKYDGHRVLASNTQIVTRGKNDVTEYYPEVIGALQAIKGSFVIDGELCVLDNRGLPDFERMNARSRKKRGGELVTFFAFDMLFDQRGKDLRGLPLLERKEKLQRLVPPEHNRLRFVSSIETLGAELFAEAVKIGMEGVVAKVADSKYVGGKNRYWLKFKQAGYHDEGFKRKKR